MSIDFYLEPKLLPMVIEYARFFVLLGLLLLLYFRRPMAGAKAAESAAATAAGVVAIVVNGRLELYRVVWPKDLTIYGFEESWFRRFLPLRWTECWSLTRKSWDESCGLFRSSWLRGSIDWLIDRLTRGGMIGLSGWVQMDGRSIIEWN